MYRKIKDAFPHISDGYGIFQQITAPVWAESFTASDLDLTFILKYGEKIQGAILRYFDADETGIPDADVAKLANLIYSHFQSQFEHLYNDYTAEYDPIENYNSTESVIEDISTKTGNTRVQDTDTSNSQIIDRETSAESSGDIYGFNSSTAVPANTSASSGTEDATITDTGSNDTTVTDTGTHTEDNSITRTRRGNIGVTTSAQMIQGDVDVWKWNYIEGVMLEIANFIGLKIYL